MVIDVKCIIMLFTPQVIDNYIIIKYKIYTHATINGYSLTLADYMIFQLCSSIDSVLN